MLDFVNSFTSLPNLHPLFVHFPVAFLTTAVVFDIFCLVFHRQTWLDKSTTITYILGALGAGAAYLAGRQAADSLIGVPPIVEPLISEHSDWGMYTLLLFSIIAVLRTAVYWRNRKSTEMLKTPLRLVVIVAAVFGQWVLFQAADRGGALVYQHGIAVASNVTEETAPQREIQLQSGRGGYPESRLFVTEDSNLIWQPLPQDSGALERVLNVVKRSPNTLISVIATIPGQKGLGLDINGRALLLLPGTYNDVHVEAELDLSNFTGTAGLVHHAKDLLNAEMFVIDSDRKASLVTISKGEGKILSDGQIGSMSSTTVLAVSAAGRHLKGMINDSVVVHGHKAPPELGGVGLLVDGLGKVFIIRVKITPI